MAKAWDIEANRGIQFFIQQDGIRKSAEKNMKLIESQLRAYVDQGTPKKVFVKDSNVFVVITKLKEGGLSIHVTPVEEVV